MRRLLCLLPLRAKLAHGGAGDRDAARRLDQPENRSRADPGSHAIRERPAADVAVVPADAYEYRHLRILAQP